MLTLPGLLVSPEHFASLVPCVTVQPGLRIKCPEIGRLNLVYRVVVYLLRLFRRINHRSRQHVVGEPHEDAVEPNLIAVYGFVPEHAVFLSAWLFLQLAHHGLHGYKVLRFGILLVHASHEVSGANVVKVVVVIFEASDFALSVYHRIGVLLAIVPNAFVAVAQVGVEHRLQLDAHDVAPLRTL